MSVWLLLVVAMTHFGSELVAKHFGLDRPSLFYVMRGLEAVFLYGLLLRHSPIVAAIALWGMYESAMTSVCGSIHMLRPVKPEAFQGLCDAQLGMPVFHYLGLVAAALLALSIILRRRDV